MTPSLESSYPNDFYTLDTIKASKPLNSCFPDPKNRFFSKVARNELKIGASCTKFYGESESEVGFSIKPKKCIKKSIF